ncbi:MAG: hypothetical protein WC058_03130 [Phycisphaeraceae bacterium]
MPDHQTIDERSLAFGRAIAAHVAADPQLIARARATVVRWLGVCSVRVQSTLRQWLTVLDGPPAGVIALLTGTDERAIRLRQSNPFAGVLPHQERNAILRRFDHHDATAA